MSYAAVGEMPVDFLTRVSDGELSRDAFFYVICSGRRRGTGRRFSARTSSSAVAKRPRNASCLSLASLQYVDRKFCFRFNTVYNVLFCQSVVRAAGCDRYTFTDASQLLFTGPARHRSIAKPAIADDRDLCLPHLHSTPPLGSGSRRTITQLYFTINTIW